ncbi:hypothetical protein ACFSR9_05800 [Deinococcus taklimakanensis]|uniref:Uncharacterized protein n=1 Tax=Deinococcus taklimakanensis TaxID=536443 RepID=A0ABW5P237_9DEIO
MYRLLLGVVVAVLGAGVAGAQTWTYDEDQYRSEFKGCTRVSNQQVVCTFADTYIGSGETDDASWSSSVVEAVLNGGQSLSNGELLVAGKRTGSTRYWGTAYKNMPVSIGIAFDIPAGVTVIPRLNYNGHVLSDVRIGGNTPAPAPTPVAAPAQQINLSGNWTGTLTGCRSSGTNTYTCAITIKK